MSWSRLRITNRWTFSSNSSKKMRERKKNLIWWWDLHLLFFCCICLSGSLFGFYFHIHDDIQTIWTNFLLWNSITRMRQKSFCSNGWDMFGRLSLVVMRSCASMAFMKQIEVTIKYELTMQGHFQWASWSYQGINQRPNYNVQTSFYFILLGNKVPGLIFKVFFGVHLPLKDLRQLMHWSIYRRMIYKFLNIMIVQVSEPG